MLEVELLTFCGGDEICNCCDRLVFRDEETVAISIRPDIWLCSVCVANAAEELKEAKGEADGSSQAV